MMAIFKREFKSYFTNVSGVLFISVLLLFTGIFTTAIKATPSISCEQESVNLKTMEAVTLEITGRHDPCIVPRAVPVVEAAAAIAIYDLILGNTQAQRRPKSWN